MRRNMFLTVLFIIAGTRGLAAQNSVLTVYQDLEEATARIARLQEKPYKIGRASCRERVSVVV